MGSHQHLDDTVIAEKCDDRLCEASDDTNCNRLQGAKLNVTKPKLTTLTEDSLQEGDQDQDIGNVVSRKKIVGSQATEQTTMRKETKDYDKPPPLLVQRDGANKIHVPRNDHGEENKDIPLVLSTTNANGSQMIRDSYDVPPVRILKHDARVDYDIPLTQKAQKMINDLL